MCRAHRAEPRPVMETVAYDGETRQLSLQSETDSSACRWRGFPWWSLWLLWPLAMLLKALAPVVAGSFALLMQPIVLEITLLPLILIGIGLLVLLAARRG